MSVLIPAPSSTYLAVRIARVLNLRIGRVEFRRFPDGEMYVRIDEDDDAIVVGSITSNDDLIALVLMLDALKGKKTVVVPYMGYARQDREFLRGEAVSIRTVAELLEERADEVVTINIHSREAESHFKKLHNLDAMPLIGERYEGKDVVMISPDRGSLERVKVAAKRAGCDYDYLEKRRIDAQTVEIQPKNLDVDGRRVVIVDDIISTGGTVIEATKKLIELGAKSVEAACVHAVLANYADLRLFTSGVREIIATDTIERIYSRISVAGIVAEHLGRAV